MPWEAILPDNASFSNSRVDPAHQSSLLFDTDTRKNMGPAQVRWVDDDGDNDEADLDLRQVAVGALVIAGVYGVAKAAPHLRKWWGESASPRVQAAWTRLGIAKRSAIPESDRSSSVARLDPVLDAPGVFERAVAQLETERAVDHGDVDAARRLTATMTSAAMLGSRLRALPRVVRDQDDVVPLVEAALETLSSPTLVNRLLVVVDPETSPLDDLERRQVAGVFTGQSTLDDAAPVTPTADDVTSALRSVA